MLAILAVIGVGGAAAFVFNTTNVEEYVKPEIIKEVMEIEKEVDVLELNKQKQWEERKADAELKAQAAYDAVMEKEQIESDLEVVRNYQTDLDELEIQLMASSSLVKAPVQ